MKEVTRKKAIQILVSMAVGAAIVFGLYAVMLLSAGTAKADSSSFIYALENSGSAIFWGPKGYFIELGYDICTDWENGYTYSYIANNVYWNNDFDRTAANVLVGAAITHLC